MVSYEMRFERGAFEAVIKAETRARFAAEVSDARLGIEYETDDLPAPTVSDDILREFVLDSLTIGAE